jgi:hypothetical protein
MSLTEWADGVGLRPHKTNATEVASLLAIVERDLANAQSQISADWRFGIAYNAALNLCAILLYASGYQAEKDLRHCHTTDALPLILYYRKDDPGYLETCRTKWTTAQHEMVEVVTERDVSGLVEFVKELRQDVLYWLEQCHPDLAPAKGS